MFKLGYKDSFCNAFVGSNNLTLPCLFILFTAVFRMTQCYLEQVSQFIVMTHGYSIIPDIYELKINIKKFEIKLTNNLNTDLIQYYVIISFKLNS